MRQPTTQVPQRVIFDSNLIQYIAQPKSTEAFNVYISDLISRGFEYAISAITIYELLKGATKRTEEKMINLLEQISTIEMKIYYSMPQSLNLHINWKESWLVKSKMEIR